MKIAVLQFAPIFGEKTKNLDTIERALQNTNADLVILPELCTTGYQFVSQEEVNTLCEPVPNGDTVKRFEKICKEKSFYLVAGIGEINRGNCYNSAVLVGPDGYIDTYRKIHLFLEEKGWFQSGKSGFNVWDIGLAKIGIMICFDWAFPEAARTLALRGADIICHPANLVLPYCQNAMITRSIENRMFTVTANRIGSEQRGGKDRLIFTGGSQAVTPKGELLFRLDREEEKLVEIEIDPQMARDKKITSMNHLWEDRRPECYQ